MGVAVADCEKPVVILRYRWTAASDAAAVPANTTRNLLPIWPILGWGTIRVYAESDVAVTLKIFQKERVGSAPVGTFRPTDQVVIPAAVLRKAFLVTGEYGRIQIVTGAAPAPVRFILFAALYPGSYAV